MKASVRVEAVRAFVAELRAHAKREDAVLYPWAAEKIDAGTWARISEALGSRDHAGGRHDVRRGIGIAHTSDRRMTLRQAAGINHRGIS